MTRCRADAVGQDDWRWRRLVQHLLLGDGRRQARAPRRVPRPGGARDGPRARSGAQRFSTIGASVNTPRQRARVAPARPGRRRAGPLATARWRRGAGRVSQAGERAAARAGRARLARLACAQRRSAQPGPARDGGHDATAH
jgi:hypothetical protein